MRVNQSSQDRKRL